VLGKWLKSHKGKTIDDFNHIVNAVGLLGEMIKVQDSLVQLHGIRNTKGEWYE